MIYGTLGMDTLATLFAIPAQATTTVLLLLLILWLALQLAKCLCGGQWPQAMTFVTLALTMATTSAKQPADPRSG